MEQRRTSFTCWISLVLQLESKLFFPWQKAPTTPSLNGQGEVAYLLQSGFWSTLPIHLYPEVPEGCELQGPDWWEVCVFFPLMFHWTRIMLDDWLKQVKIPQFPFSPASVRWHDMLIRAVLETPSLCFLSDSVGDDTFSIEYRWVRVHVED